MPNILKSAFVFSLLGVCAFGVNLAFSPRAFAGTTCPICYIFDDAPGWSLYGNCNDFSDPHCPVLYHLYKNDYSGQMCRGEDIIGQL